MKRTRWPFAVMAVSNLCVFLLLFVQLYWHSGFGQPYASIIWAIILSVDVSLLVIYVRRIRD